MKTQTIEIKQKPIGRKIEIWIIQTAINSFGKEYKTKKLFDYCYKTQTKRLKELLQQADNLYGFNGFDICIR